MHICCGAHVCVAAAAYRHGLHLPNCAAQLHLPNCRLHLPNCLGHTCLNVSRGDGACALRWRAVPDGCGVVEGLEAAIGSRLFASARGAGGGGQWGESGRGEEMVGGRDGGSGQARDGGTGGGEGDGGAGGGEGGKAGGFSGRRSCARRLDVWYLWAPSFAMQTPALRCVLNERRVAGPGQGHKEPLPWSKVPLLRGSRNRLACRSFHKLPLLIVTYSYHGEKSPCHGDQPRSARTQRKEPRARGL